VRALPRIEDLAGGSAAVETGSVAEGGEKVVDEAVRVDDTDARSGLDGEDLSGFGEDLQGSDSPGLEGLPVEGGRPLGTHGEGFPGSEMRSSASECSGGAGRQERMKAVYELIVDGGHPVCGASQSLQHE
jgi:hypothetical protein